MRRATRTTGAGLGVPVETISGTAGLALRVRMLKIKCLFSKYFFFEMKYCAGVTL